MSQQKNKQRKIGCWLALLFFAACSPSASKQYLKPADITEFKQDKPFGKFTAPKVDILFVIDDSGSMGSHQDNLSANIPIFTSEFTKKAEIDFKLAIITSTIGSSTCENCNGKFVGENKVLSPKTPNFLAEIAKNLLVGTYGSGLEQFFDPIVAALSEPNISTVNANFLRKNVPLAIIFLTDTEDQSQNVKDAKQLYQFLMNLKGKDPTQLIAYGVYIPTWEMASCEGEGSKPLRIEEFLGLVSNANPAGSALGNSYSLCDKEFGKRLAEIAADIANRASRIYLLNDSPVVESIEVSYGTDPVPRDIADGWSYDLGKNAVVIGPKFKWDPPGSTRQISVKYEISDFGLPKQNHH